MSNIIITTIQERSSFNAALNVAVLLSSHGHRVRFMGVNRSDSREHVEKHGFEYIGIGPRDTGKLDEALANTKNPYKIWKLLSAAIVTAISDIDALEKSADIALVDVCASSGLAAYFLARLKIPTVLIM